MGSRFEIFTRREKSTTFLEEAQQFLRQSPRGSILDASTIPPRTNYRSEPTPDEEKLARARQVLKEMLQNDRNPHKR